MAINRRDFFKVAFAAGVASVAPIALGERLATIYGDGVHDDTEGLQAALDGNGFHARNGCVSVRDGVLYIQGGLYQVSETLVIGSDSKADCRNATFRWCGKPDGGPLLHYLGPSEPPRGCVFITNLRVMP